MAQAQKANLFDKAKKATPASTGKRKNTKPQFDIESLRDYAALKNAAKQIDAALELLKEEVNEQAFNLFMERRDASSFNGVDGDTTASLQLRRRTSRSVLSESEMNILESHNIDIEKTEDSRFYIDRRYSDNADLLGQVSEALNGIVPDDFFGHTGDKYVVGGEALSQTMKIDDDSDRAVVAKIVGTQAARTKFGGSNEEALDILREVIFPKPESVE
jgi:hypothetical protein